MDAQAPVWGRLTQRAEFQRAAKGRRIGASAFTLQANARAPETAHQGPRVGLTVTKKTGNSPVRNRIRRRLREAIRRVPATEARADFDYVLMARRDALTLAFEALVADIAAAIGRAHAPRPARDGRS
ncbi:MAG: ribonuclease P protein component [Pseudomonadota bacterium]|nr:ribonuclease P protein component [Pseudomonadota bacterium]